MVILGGGAVSYGQGTPVFPSVKALHDYDLPPPSQGATIETVQGLSPESHGQNLTLNVLRVSYSLDSGSDL